MAASRQRWDFFGIDLRSWWLGFCGAWREVFWDHGSGVRAWVDEPVSLYRAGTLLNTGTANVTKAKARAELLPDAMVLIKRLPLPKGLALDLPSLVQGEVLASSPFKTDDTAFGWRLLEGPHRQHEVLLAIVSKSAVMGHLHSLDAHLSVNSVEVWAEDSGKYVVINGFAEQQRDIRYRKRLWQLGGMAVMVALAFLIATSAPMVYKAVQITELEASLAQVQGQVSKSVKLRSSLTAANQRVEQLNTITQSSARPLEPLNRLTQQLGDDASLLSYQQKGHIVTIEGVANNAAELLQRLSQSGHYEDVKPVSAIRAVSRSTKERFKVELMLKPAQAGQS